jgi:hypothetical protein
MATAIKQYPQDSIEHKAYACIEDIAFTEFNDKNRLGYHVFLFLTKEITTLKEAIHVAQARMAISEEEAHTVILAKLRALGLEANAS